MALQNRCDPFGALHAVDARGQMMGNRGGRFHLADRTLGTRQFKSKRWICCLCDFNNRQRTVFGEGYTELFFLDEVTALAAGHRPCFECRRVDARDFAARLAAKGSKPPKAGDMDTTLHRERMELRKGNYRTAHIKTLPEGAMFLLNGKPCAVYASMALTWDFSGYLEARPLGDGQVDLLTPATCLQVLANGYRPQWHASAKLLA